MEPVGAYSNVYNGGYAELMRLTAGHLPEGPERSRRAPRRAHGADGRRSPRGRARGSDSRRCRDRARRRAGRARGRRRAAPPRRRDDRRQRQVARAGVAVALAMGATEAVDPADDDPIDAWQRVDGRAHAGGVRRDRRTRLSRRSPSRTRLRCRACRRGRIVHAERHDSSRAPADEAAHDRVLVRVRPVRVRRHLARDRRGRDRRHAR